MTKLIKAIHLEITNFFYLKKLHLLLKKIIMFKCIVNGYQYPFHLDVLKSLEEYHQYNSLDTKT